nr:MAG TPA: hypothetical protein [Caudoviricetes sp.]
MCSFLPDGGQRNTKEKSLRSEDDRRLQLTENGHNEVRWVHLHP